MPDKEKVLVTRILPGNAIQTLREFFDVEVFEEDRPIPRELLLERIENVFGLLTLLTDRIDSEVIERGKRLKVIANYAVGYDNIDIETATRRGIVVTNTPDVLTNATAELTLALIFAVMRRIHSAHNFVSQKNWKAGWSPTLYLGQEIKGKTLGILGAGRIGTAVGLKSKGLEVKVVYFSRRRNELLEKTVGAEKVGFDEIIKNSDILTIHLPLSKDTHHIISYKEFGMMKSNLALINVARGAVVDETALIEALKEGKIYGAGLDVYENEPDINPEFFGLDNVVLLPHIGSATQETREKMADMAVKSIIDVLEGNIPPNIVNREVYEKSYKIR